MYVDAVVSHAAPNCDLLFEMLALQLTERSISTLVSDGSIYAKIDRPAKIVSFHRPLSAEEQLSNWSGTSTGLCVCMASLPQF